MQEVVQEARNDFENGLIDQGLLIELYRGYKDVGDTVRFVTKARNIFPNGNCGLASLYLKRKLGGEIVHGKYEKHDHTFLLSKDTVIDITADQFGGPKVYVGPLRLPWSFEENRRA